MESGELLLISSDAQCRIWSYRMQLNNRFNERTDYQAIPDWMNACIMQINTKTTTQKKACGDHTHQAVEIVYVYIVASETFPFQYWTYDLEVTLSMHRIGILRRICPPLPKLCGLRDNSSVTQSIENYRIICKTANQLEHLGASLATKARIGDVLLLTGSVGAGKTCLARGFIQKLTGDKTLGVPSPTYLLDNTYRIASMDLT